MFLFKPTSQDMKIEYPELREVKEFVELKTAEFKFVWYYGSRTSPFFDVVSGERNKRLICTEKAFGKKDRDADWYKKYLSGNFPSKIKAAIERMGRYSPSARLRAKMAAENVLDTLEESLEISKEMKDEMEKDFEMKRKHIDLSIKVIESMPNIVSQIEDGFGIRAFEKKGSKERQPTLMDVLHGEDDE